VQRRQAFVAALVAFGMGYIMATYAQLYHWPWWSALVVGLGAMAYIAWLVDQ